MTTEKLKVRREEPPPSCANRERVSPVWGVVAAAEASPGVWVAIDVPRNQNIAGGMVNSVKRRLTTPGYTFTTRRKTDDITTVYCMYQPKKK